MIALQLIELPDPVDQTDQEAVTANAAYVAAAGVDAAAYLRCEDELEQQLLLDVARQVHERRAIERHNLAVEIANCVGELFG